MGARALLARWAGRLVICGLHSDTGGVCVELLGTVSSHVGESLVEQGWTGTVLCRALLKVDYSGSPVIRGLAKSEILEFWLWYTPKSKVLYKVNKAASLVSGIKLCLGMRSKLFVTTLLTNPLSNILTVKSTQCLILCSAEDRQLGITVPDKEKRLGYLI